MSTRLDTSPQARLRALASTLALGEHDVDEALAACLGDAAAAAEWLQKNKPAAGPAGPAGPAAWKLSRWAREATRRTLTREERVHKCATALATTPDALDILHASLAKVLEQPHSEKYRTVKVGSGAFRERVASQNPAGVELLYAVGYEPMHGHLVLQKHEPAILALALEELKAAKSLPTYVAADAARADVRARKAAAAQDASAKEARRAHYLAKVPAEPAEGGIDSCASSACVISIGVAWGHDQAPLGAAAKVATRRFESDCTLNDLVSYVRSLQAVDDPDGEISLANVTTRPTRVLEPSREGEASLYALDLWPRGRIEVRQGVRVGA